MPEFDDAPCSRALLGAAAAGHPGNDLSSRVRVDHAPSRRLARDLLTQFEAGTAIDRRFTAAHAYRGAGVYSVRVTLRRVGRAVASATTTVHVRSSFGGAETPE